MNSTGFWTGLGGAIFVIGLARSLASDLRVVDEGWFLQVVQRVRSGDVLYRDVYFGITPLSLYLTTALTHVVGIEVVAVKIVTNVCFAVTTVLTGGIALRSGLSMGTALLMMSVLVACLPPDLNPPYSPLAFALFLAVLSVVSARLGDDRRVFGYRDAVVIGVLAGLSFAAKQNVGLLLLGASLGAMLWVDPSRAHRRRLVRCVPLCVAAWSLTTLIALAPTIATGGMSRFLEYGFAAKGAYVEHGAHYPNLRNWIGTLKTLAPTDAVAELVQGGVFLVLPVTVIAALIKRRAFDRRSRILALFAAAAVAAAFPRWDRLHLAYAVPAVLLFLGYRIRGTLWPATGRRMSDLTLGWWCAAGCALLIGADTGRSVMRTGLRTSEVPHVRGILLAAEDERHLRDTAARLAAAADGQPLFMLSLRAGFWYLVSGVQNPTPFDIPGTTSTGLTGERILFEQISNGTLRNVCLDHDLRDPIDLTGLAAFIKGRFVKGPDVGPCTVYRAPAAAFGPSPSTRAP